MPIYQDVFGGANIYPSEISYSTQTLSADVTLSWPEETSTNTNLATRIIDVEQTAASPTFSIIVPDATKSGTGNTILFNNKGSYTFLVKDAEGNQIGSVAAGQVWQLYLTNNSTIKGTWVFLQYGATTSTANASSLAGTGIIAIGTVLSQSVPVTTFNTNFTSGVDDRAKMFNYTGAGGTYTLPDPITGGDNWFVYLRNSGSGAITATPPGAVTIDGAANIPFQPGESAIIVTDGASFFTIGFGQSATFSFDYTTISIAGQGAVTLTGTELNRVAYKFTGALTGARTVIIPATVQQYWIDNSTTGSFILTVKVAGQPGVNIGQNTRGIFYCDGTDLVDADTSTISFPLSIAQGGTGATTASGARINLGGGSTGISLLTSGTQGDAWTALGYANAFDGGTF